MRTRVNNIRGHLPRGGMRRAGLRALAVGAVLAVPLVGLAAPAGAQTGLVLSGGVLQITAGSANNNMSVNVALNGSLVIRDFADTVVAPSACTQVSAFEVNCPSGGVTRITADMGGGSDTLRNNTTLRSTVFLSTGDDLFIGGPNADAVSAGSGADTMRGNGGNDILLGGLNVDFADGGAGADSCTAETELSCES